MSTRSSIGVAKQTREKEDTYSLIILPQSLPVKERMEPVLAVVGNTLSRSLERKAWSVLVHYKWLYGGMWKM